MAEPADTLIRIASSHVTGPQIPLYLAGRTLLHWCGLAPLGARMGLFTGIASYNQVLTLAATVAPLLVPDVWAYAAFLTDAFVEVRDAAGVPPADAAGGAPPAPARSPQPVNR